ncbi:MAG: alpha-amylase family glycosyl hydrolase [Oscillospiraceae bacterium]|nr:alpha-amylase family glycosyl hydrolase [Oscillospiraceae bacterium]
MSWESSALFYHIYPLGLCGAPWVNEGGEPVDRISKIHEWIPHMKRMHVNAVYFSPLWESGTHGYDTHDYTILDRRLGTNEDFARLCDALHANGIRIVVDGVFNHVGRGFFAFQDVLRNGQNSPYCSWFCNLWFGNSNRFGDPFSYESWHGCEELVKLNLKNNDVVKYLENAILGWMDQFHIDGIRFDAADCIDHDFFRRIRHVVKSKNPDMWLMGELIHGNYAQYANPDMLDSSTNYECWKGIWSSHNDKNYFEINYAMNRQKDIYRGLQLYNFADNHDVARLATQLKDKRHLPLVYAMLYAMPGVPSVYYGSEFAIQGEKRQDSDENLRPALNLQEMDAENNSLTKFLYRLGAAYEAKSALHHGNFATVEVRNQQLEFRRGEGDEAVYCVLNLQDCPSDMPLPVGGDNWYDLISGRKIDACGHVNVPAFTAMWIAKSSEAELAHMDENVNMEAAPKPPVEKPAVKEEPVKQPVEVSEIAEEPKTDEPVEMTAAELVWKLALLDRCMTRAKLTEAFGKEPTDKQEGSNVVYEYQFDGGVTLRLWGDPILRAALQYGDRAFEIML